MSVYVSIGRNIGAGPMPAEDWEAFRAAARSAVIRGTDGGELVSATIGTGYWEGTREETAVIVHSGTPNDRLRMLLGIVRDRFGQDAIALTVAEPDFV